ncbi:MAG TPA: hypothetical protein VFD89_06380, partial [Clostridia bacterium]|nr:hypothetical protein [Clostridia bacterium]
LYTDEDGNYAWDVPEGLWQVQYELDGYETIYSNWLPVPPPQTDVNIDMISITAPKLESLNVFADRIDIVFDKYIDPATVNGILIKDKTGGKIGYKIQYSEEETSENGTVYTETFVLKFDSKQSINDIMSIDIPNTVQSYSGVPIEAYSKNFLSDDPDGDQGWKKNSNGEWYYLSEDGKMVTGWMLDADKWYFMDEKTGIMQTGWLKSGGKWYYFNKSGVMQSGWVPVGGKWYYMDSSGAMTTGWQKVGGKWYYMNASGAMTTGWQKVGGKWYYISASGAMTTGWQKVGGKWYYMGASGAMTTGWQKVDGKWYYMDKSGIMQIGWLLSGGKWYYLYPDGSMAVNTTIGKYRIDNKGVWTA